MISRDYMKDHPEVDWSVHNDQNKVKPSVNEQEEKPRENYKIGSPPESSEKVSTMFGLLPKPDTKKMFSRESTNEATNEGMNAISGINVIGKSVSALNAGNLAKSAYEKGKQGLDYLNPKNIGEELRNKFGSGSVSENIEELGNRVKFAKGSAKEEALVPKREFMEEAKGQRIKYESPENHYPQSMTVEQADKKMSDLKEKIRDLHADRKKRGLNDAEKDRLASHEAELENTKNDWGNFVKTLPEKTRGKYQDFLKKYAINVGPYEDASFIVRKLASGDSKGVQPDSLNRIFTNPNPNKEILKITKDIGSAGWNNIVFNMLSKHKLGDVKGMSNAILEGHRKGSPIITDEMAHAAHHALTRLNMSNAAKAAAGGAIGASVFGPAGAVAGAALPFARQGAGKLINYLKR